MLFVYRNYTITIKLTHNPAFRFFGENSGYKIQLNQWEVRQIPESMRITGSES